MKKLILLTVTFIYFSTSIFAGPPWWKTALVDAAGALGGAGSVASGLAYVGAVSNPAGWIACGVGAVVGGAGSSIAYAGLVQPDGTNGGLNEDDVKNNNNTFDYIGLYHNKLVIDYYPHKDNLSGENLIAFYNDNSSNYGNVDLNFTEAEDVDSLINAANSLRGLSFEYFIEQIVTSLPTFIDKIEFTNFLISNSTITDKKLCLENIKTFENQLLSDENLDELSKMKLASFFSTFRYSISLWN